MFRTAVLQFAKKVKEVHPTLAFTMNKGSIIMARVLKDHGDLVVEEAWKHAEPSGFFKAKRQMKIVLQKMRQREQLRTVRGTETPETVVKKKKGTKVAPPSFIYSLQPKGLELLDRPEDEVIEELESLGDIVLKRETARRMIGKPRSEERRRIIEERKDVRRRYREDDLDDFDVPLDGLPPQYDGYGSGFRRLSDEKREPQERWGRGDRREFQERWGRGEGPRSSREFDGGRDGQRQPAYIVERRASWGGSDETGLHRGERRGWSSDNGRHRSSSLPPRRVGQSADEDRRGWGRADSWDGRERRSSSVYEPRSGGFGGRDQGRWGEEEDRGRSSFGQRAGGGVQGRRPSVGGDEDDDSPVSERRPAAAEDSRNCLGAWSDQRVRREPSSFERSPGKGDQRAGGQVDDVESDDDDDEEAEFERDDEDLVVPRPRGGRLRAGRR